MTTADLQKIREALDKLLYSYRELHDNPTLTEIYDEPAKQAIALLDKLIAGLKKARG